MKRGLKGVGPVTTVSPMKRGLKDRREHNRFPDDSQTIQSYNRFPDEKGTERADKSPPRLSHWYVTTVSPMKRGLKVQACDRNANRSGVTTVSPMKRGLKGLDSVIMLECAVGYNRFPDEKGTESIHAFPR